MELVRPLSVLMVLAAWAVPAGVLAQPTPRVTPQTAQTPEERRQALIDEAVRLRARGEHAQALTLAQDAERLGLSPSLLMFIAQEYQSLGNLGEAWRYAGNCLGMAANSASLEDRERVMRRCQEIRQITERETAVIELQVAPDVPRTATLTLGGHLVAPEAWTVPQRVRAGEVVVEVTVAGVSRFHEALTVRPQTTHAIHVRIARDASSGGAPVVAPAPPAAACADVGATHERSSWPVVFLITGGVLTAGGVGALVRGHLLQEDRDRDLANGPYDETAEREINNEIGWWKAIGHIALGAGAATLVGGLVWFLHDRAQGNAPPRRTLVWAPQWVPGGGMITVGGAL